jgi:fatty acid desaturase
MVVSMMARYARWSATSQGAWVVSMLFVLLALINVAFGAWLLAAIFVGVAVVNLLRSRKRLGAGPPDS